MHESNALNPPPVDAASTKGSSVSSTALLLRRCPPTTKPSVDEFYETEMTWSVRAFPREQSLDGEDRRTILAMGPFRLRWINQPSIGGRPTESPGRSPCCPSLLRPTAPIADVALPWRLPSIVNRSVGAGRWLTSPRKVLRRTTRGSNLMSLLRATTFSPRR